MAPPLVVAELPLKVVFVRVELAFERIRPPPTSAELPLKVTLVTAIALTNVTFSGNSAEVGGGLILSNANSTLTNTTFNGNSATTSGGAIYNYESTLTIKN